MVAWGGRARGGAYQEEWGNSLERWMCSLSWLWWWSYWCTYRSKYIHLWTINMYSWLLSKIFIFPASFEKLESIIKKYWTQVPAWQQGAPGRQQPDLYFDLQQSQSLLVFLIIVLFSSFITFLVSTDTLVFEHCTIFVFLASP